MKNSSVLIGLVTFVIICIMFFLFENPKKQKFTGENSKETNKSFNSLVEREKSIIDDFIKENEVYLDEGGYQNLKFKDFYKSIEFKNMNQKSKNAVILSKCILIKKKTKEISENLSQDQTTQQKIKQFQEKTNVVIDKQIKSLYLDYGSKIHPIDKIFLEKIHE